MTTEKELTGYPSIDKPWLKYYSEEAINAKLPECTIYEYLWENNKDHLNDVALNYYGRKFTYKQVFEGIDKATKSFSALGVKKGDIVIVCTVNTPEMIYTLYALNRLGAIANMVDPRTNIDGIHEYIAESNAQFVLTIDLAYPAIKKAAQGTSVKNVIVVSPSDSLPSLVKAIYKMKNKSPQFGDEVLDWKKFISIGKDANPECVAYEKNACCVMAHTGGTTGSPKGVMLSNDNINAVAFGYQYLGIPFERKHRYFNDLPPFIMYGLCLATHTTLSYGLEVILYPIFDSKGFPKQFVKYKPHHFSALVDHLKYLTIDKKTEKIDMSFLISPGVGGDAVECKLEQDVNKFLAEHNCQYEVCKGYGMTELSATAVITFKGANAIGSVGIPLISNTIKIVDTETSQELGYNETGEIWISSPSIMLGYYNKPQETSEIIITDEKGVRWVRTGDLGHITEDGLLFHEGRIRRIYMTAHEGQPAKIFPMLVEGALKKSQYVSECSVVGRKRKNSDYYEAVAFIVKNSDTTDTNVILEDISKQCDENVPTYMIPAEYCFVDELPHTPVGKVDFRALEKEAEKL
ncbi:MAG: acyl--CoA ligase [Ruminococcaceae bacterium]|nr:acyl--CoA ligase [Oscillospiraceae bacterium]